jgi:predicted RNase H-like HicB family nuclease
MKSEAEVEPGYIVVYNYSGASLFPQWAWIAYQEGACGDDACAYGATPEEAVENLKEALDIE